MGRGTSKAGGERSAGVGGGNGAATSGRASISGRPYDANDWKTWTVGTKVEYSEEGDFVQGENGMVKGVAGRTLDGTVTEVHDDHLIIDVPSVSDHMWMDKDFIEFFRGKRR